jgi:hypothetical protein
LRFVVLSEFIWNKPVLCIFKERDVNPEVDPFVVVKAKKLTITKNAEAKYSGSIMDFFTLMGDADYLTTKEGLADRYVICWFDDTEPDMTKDLRRMKGVSFKAKATCVINDTGKRTYNATFNAVHAKLK